MSRTTENVDLGSVILADPEFRDETLTFAGSATYPEGTILARSTATGKLVPYVKGGNTDGNGTPKAVLTYGVTRSTAGDLPVRAMISGKVKLERLVIAADGDSSNVDAVVFDLLRAVGIVPLSVEQRAVLDNQ